MDIPDKWAVRAEAALGMALGASGLVLSDPDQPPSKKC